jgi:hypothetical protein
VFVRSRFMLSVLLMSLAGAVPVSASPFDITNTTGQWQNGVGGPLTLPDNQAGHGVDNDTFSLIGFSPDGLKFNSSYLSQQLASNPTKSKATKLFAVVSSKLVATPEPAALLLLGSGLAAAAGAARRMRNRRAARGAMPIAAPTQD